MAAITPPKAVRLATKTIQLIDDTVRADQGASFRRHLALVLPHIKDIYRPEKESFRAHMGASILGKECARDVWYSWRWITPSDFEGRMMRLFNRGHMEEARFIALLLMIGCEVYQQDENGKQYRITHADGHVGGSGDGIVVGIPDLTVGMPALGEFKTHNDKSFTELKAKGVREAKFEHYVQAQIYMRKMALAVCLYLAVNKNTDELYGELLSLDSAIADQFLERGRKLVDMEEPPFKISKSPGFWKCRFCDHKAVCHQGAPPAVNCRTCIYSTPVSSTSGGWACRLHNILLSEEAQLAACQRYTAKKM